MKRLLGLMILDAIFIAIVGTLSPHFVSAANISTLLSNMALEVIALTGLILLMICGLFDLSVDGVTAMSAVICGKLLNAGVPVPVSILAAMLGGGVVGYINGYLVSRLKINALIATLGMWWVCLGIAYGITKAISPFGFPESFQAIGQAKFLGMRMAVWYAAVVVLVATLVLNYMRFGRHVLVIGGNREAARLFGIPVFRTEITLYVLMGLLGAFVGIVMSARLNAGAPNSTDGMTMRLVAAAVIGGCALSGGRGSIIGGVLGLLLMNMLTNAAILLGVSPYWQRALVGSVLLAAVLLDRAGGSLRVNIPWRKVEQER